jgi:hypothetical protein
MRPPVQNLYCFLIVFTGHFAKDPSVGFLHPGFELLFRFPAQLFLDQTNISITVTHAFRARNIVDFEIFAGDSDHHLCKIIDRNHFLIANVRGLFKIRAEQPGRAFDTFIGIEERAGLQAIASNFDSTPIGGLSHFSAHGSGRFFFSTFPDAVDTKDIVITRHPAFYPEVATIGKVEALQEERFPTVFTVSDWRDRRCLQHNWELASGPMRSIASPYPRRPACSAMRAAITGWC